MIIVNWFVKKKVYKYSSAASGACLLHECGTSLGFEYCHNVDWWSPSKLQIIIFQDRLLPFQEIISFAIAERKDKYVLKCRLQTIISTWSHYTSINAKISNVPWSISTCIMFEYTQLSVIFVRELWIYFRFEYTPKKTHALKNINVVILCCQASPIPGLPCSSALRLVKSILMFYGTKYFIGCLNFNLFRTIVEQIARLIPCPYYAMLPYFNTMEASHS